MIERFLNVKLLAVAGAAAAITGLAGCSEPPASNGDGGSSGAGAPGEETTITVYTSEPEDKIDEINAAFEEANKDIKVEVYRAGTGDLTARIEAEKNSGKIGADVLWAADSPTFEKFKHTGDLAKLTGVDQDAVIEPARDEDGYYVGTRIIPTVIAYNNKVIDQAAAPSSWQDLTDPRFADKIVLPDPAVSGAAAFNATVWKNTSTLGGPWIEALGKNRPMVAASNGPTSQEVAGGGRPVGVVVDYLIRDLAADGSPMTAVYPSEGAPFITEPIGVFEPSEKKSAAERYINFILSEEGQKIAVSQNYLPVLDTVGTPDGAPALKDIPLMETDLDTLTTGRKTAVEFFQDAMT